MVMLHVFIDKFVFNNHLIKWSIFSKASCCGPQFSIRFQRSCIFYSCYSYKNKLSLTSEPRKRHDRVFSICSVLWYIASNWKLPSKYYYFRFPIAKIQCLYRNINNVENNVRLLYSALSQLETPLKRLQYITLHYQSSIPIFFSVQAAVKVLEHTDKIFHCL
jgi:hypothetical protein